MTNEETIRMAREAGLVTWASVIPEKSVRKWENFATLVAAAEREACARVCDVQVEMNRTGAVVAELCAALIRARGEA